MQQIVSLWVGPALGDIERMCLASFVAHGHPVALYGYDPVGNLPPGVEWRDAAAVLPRERLDEIAGPRQALSLFANYFRLLLLQRGLGLWVDADVVCHRPVQLVGAFVAGRESARYLNNAVLHLSPNSPVLLEMLALFDAGQVPDWVPLHRAPAAWLKRLAGRPVPAWALPRGTFGPKGLTALAEKHGLIEKALPPAYFYPLHPRQAEKLYEPGLRLDDIVTPETLTIHLWNEKLGELRKTPPPAGSIMAELLERYPG